MSGQIRRNSEEAFALASVLEFFHLWRSKKEASLTIECREGEASINFKCSLGHPDQRHISNTRAKKKKRKSANRASRDNARAAAYQAERGQPPTASRPPAAATPQDGSSCSQTPAATTPKRTATSPLESSPKRVELPVWNPDNSSPGVLRESHQDVSRGEDILQDVSSRTCLQDVSLGEDILTHNHEAREDDYCDSTHDREDEDGSNEDEDDSSEDDDHEPGPLSSAFRETMELLEATQGFPPFPPQSDYGCGCDDPSHQCCWPTGWPKCTLYFTSSGQYLVPLNPEEWAEWESCVYSWPRTGTSD